MFVSNKQRKNSLITIGKVLSSNHIHLFQTCYKNLPKKLGKFIIQKTKWRQFAVHFS